MKRILFVLPLSVLLTYCSSTRPAIAPGVSNVQVNGLHVSDSSIAATTNNSNRDWGYHASKDTALSGTWQLEGMIAADGSWKTSEAWRPVEDTTTTTTTVIADSAVSAQTPSTNNAAMSNTPQTASTKKSFGSALYDTTMHYFDTAAFRQTLADKVKPFEYWRRLPEIKISPAMGIFSGNTGCNMMTGSFNFAGNDIKFNNNLRTSKMACNDYDESVFVSDLLKADHYTITNDLLELKQGNTTVLSFRKKTL